MSYLIENIKLRLFHKIYGIVNIILNGNIEYEKKLRYNGKVKLFKKIFSFIELYLKSVKFKEREWVYCQQRELKISQRKR